MARHQVRRIAQAVLTGLLVTLLVVPASAHKAKDKDTVNEGAKDEGTIMATVVVGKNRDGCQHDGSSAVSGPGLGLPHQAPKNAYYKVQAPNGVDSIHKGVNGLLRLCGRLDRMVSNANGGLGSACGASKGWDGRGIIAFPAKPTLWLKDVGWKATVGSILLVTGRVTSAPDEATAKAKLPSANDMISAQLTAMGSGCTNKVDGPNKSGGATTFMLTGSYEIVNGTPPDQTATPATCKSGGTRCAYQTKKVGKNG